jgi:LysM repeat protein
VFGVAPDQATREKIVLCCGNVAGVAAVKDMMSVDQSQPEAQYYTVASGDNLSKISKQFYGDPNQYTKIFDANKPMLTSPDRIYPGQKLRIPPQCSNASPCCWRMIARPGTPVPATMTMTTTRRRSATRPTTTKAATGMKTTTMTTRSRSRPVDALLHCSIAFGRTSRHNVARATAAAQPRMLFLLPVT